MLRLAIMQPYFFPYIGYFQCIHAVDKYILYSNLNFIKEAWINRNRILVKNSQPIWITVPLKKKSSFSKIDDIEIDDSRNWRKKIKKTIFLNYQKSPMFNEVFPIFEKILDFDTSKLNNLNVFSIITICNYLNIKTIIESDNSIYNDIEENLKNLTYSADYQYSLGKSHILEPKVIRVIKICKMEQANIFINAFGGQELYSKDIFKEFGIDLYFIKSKDINYKQFNNEFIPWLSIIDVLMFNSKEKIQGMLNQYELL